MKLKHYLKYFWSAPAGRNHTRIPFWPARAFRIPFRIGVLIFLLSVPSIPAFAKNNSLTDAQLLKIKFDQKLNSQVSLNLVFRDSTGKKVQLGDCCGQKPTILLMGYYTCPMLCTLVLNGMTESLRDLKWSVGKQFNVVFVSIDPKDTPKLAAEKKAAYLRDYGRAGAASGWHFLTGKKLAIQTLADEIGFRYAYDSGLKQYAHPSGFVVLTPQGKVMHYFFGVTFSAKEVDQALRDASARKIDSPVREFILLCCQYSPLRGKYGYMVMDMVRVGGVLMVLGLGYYFFRSFMRKPVSGAPPANGANAEPMNGSRFKSGMKSPQPTAEQRNRAIPTGEPKK